MCDGIDETNKTNSQTLAVTDVGVQQLRAAEMIYNNADYELNEALNIAKRHLRRFGWPSVFYRYLRFRIRGVYYTFEEMVHVKNPDFSLRGFLVLSMAASDHRRPAISS